MNMQNLAAMMAVGGAAAARARRRVARDYGEAFARRVGVARDGLACGRGECVARARHR